MLPRPTRTRIASLLTSIALASGAAHGATFTWTNTTATWSDPSKWSPVGAPSGTNNTDILVFGGDVGTTAGVAPNYTSTNDIATVPFQLGSITLNATDFANLPSDPTHVIAGSPLFFSGTTATITQNNAGGITFNTPIRFGVNPTWAGNGAGAVTFNAGLSGFVDITKSGSSTFRFGTLAAQTPSDNSWIGNLTVNGGTIRFNNNNDSGRTALRSNAVTLSAGSSLSCASTLRLGALNGALGSSISSLVTGTNTDNEDIVITAVGSGTYAGSVQLGAPTGTGNDSGKLIVRGPGEQILSGTLAVEKDVFIGGALTLRGTASLGAQTKGAVVLAGGTFRLDNATSDNLPSRLRDGSSSSTGLDAAGGGAFIFDGAAAGSSETLGRLQMGSVTGVTPRSRPRSGQVDVVVRHRGGASGTQLTFQSYERDGSTQFPLLTVQFSATDGAGAFLPLGLTGSSPRVVFNSLPTSLNDGLLNNPGGPNSTGWAVVQAADGLAFATHGANGIEPVLTTPIWASNSDANAELIGNQVINSNFNLRSLRIKPSGPNGHLDVNSGSLVTTGIILTGPNDYTINGPGTLGGTSPRFIHVDQAVLNLGTPLTAGSPLAKSGDGTLILSGANFAHLSPVAINRGALRVNVSATLSGGELRFRGGVLEAAGGGLFNRPLVDVNGVSAPGTVNWAALETVSGTPSSVQEDRGSGGFAAMDSDLTVDLGASGSTPIPWESPGFVQSGYALIFGSKAATAKTIFVDSIGLSSTETTVNYNAREVRVVDNPASATDRGVISGVITGTLQNDLLKTGDGTLELFGTNSFQGTAIIQAGTLLVSGSISSSNATHVRSGATLAGSGSVTQILLENGGTIAPGDGGVGTLKGTGLTWRGGGVLKCDLGAGVMDCIDLGSGALVKGTAGGPFTIDFGGSGQGGRTYVVAKFGSTNFNIADFAPTNVSPDLTGAFQIVGGELQYVTTSIAPPGVTTGDATNITTAAATLSGVVNPKGVATTARFEYGTSTAYGSFVDVVPDPGAGADPVPVSVSVSNLDPLTTYHFRLVATSGNGTTNGDDKTFTTSGLPPDVTTGAPTDLTSMGVTIHGTVDPNGSATTAKVEYGLTVSYGSSVVISPAPGNGTDPVDVSAAIGGLAPFMTYHYRIVANNSFGTTNGSDGTFMTLPVAPEVVTGSATAITSSGATLNGTVDPNGTATTAFFEYGLSTDYGSTVSVTAPGMGSEPVNVSAVIDSLAPNMVYHFRVVAQNPGGTVQGEDATFMTNRLPPNAVADTLFVSKGSITADLLANDINPETGTSSGLTFDGIVTQPAFGTLTPGATVTYKPNKKFPVSGDTFTYRVKDAFGGTDTATVTIKSFTSLKGALAGIIVAGNGDVEDTGSISVKTSATDKFTASLIWARKKYALKGTIGANGLATIVKAKSGAPGSNLTLTLQLGADGGMELDLADSSTASSYTATLYRAATDNTGLAITAGVFTATVDPTTEIAGDGYAVFTVSKKRDARIVGRTPDGEAFSDASKLFGSRWIVDPLLYKRGKTNAGQARSEIAVQGGNAISSDFEWFKTPVPTDPLNPEGIAEADTIEGGKFTSSGENGLTVISSGFGGSSAVLTFSDGDLTAPMTANITFTAKKVTITNSQLTGLKVKLSTKSGLFTGEFKHPVSGKKTTFAAAFRRDVGEARGNFRGPTAAGNVLVQGPIP